MGSKRTKEEKRLEIAQIAEQGLERLVTKRLTTRNQQWVLTEADGRNVYETNWADFSSLYDPVQVRQKIHDVLAQAEIYAAQIDLAPEQGVAVRIRVPKENFKPDALAALGSSQPLRIHEHTGRGGR